MKPEINRTFIDHNFAKQQNKKRKEIQLNSLHGISASQVIIRDQEKPHNIALSINVCVQVSRAVIKIKTNCNKKKKWPAPMKCIVLCDMGKLQTIRKWRCSSL